MICLSGHVQYFGFGMHCCERMDLLTDWCLFCVCCWVTACFDVAEWMGVLTNWCGWFCSVSLVIWLLVHWLFGSRFTSYLVAGSLAIFVAGSLAIFVAGSLAILLLVHWQFWLLNNWLFGCWFIGYSRFTGYLVAGSLTIFVAGLLVAGYSAIFVDGSLAILLLVHWQFGLLVYWLFGCRFIGYFGSWFIGYLVCGSLVIWLLGDRSFSCWWMNGCVEWLVWLVVRCFIIA